jgi:hypothetical protein
MCCCLFVAECMCPSIHDEIHDCLDMDVGAMGAIASIRLQPRCAHCATHKHDTHTTRYVARARWHTTHHRSSLWPTSTITTLCTTTHRARGSRCMQQANTHADLFVRVGIGPGIDICMDICFVLPSIEAAALSFAQGSRVKVHAHRLWWAHWPQPRYAHRTTMTVLTFGARDPSTPR